MADPRRARRGGCSPRGQVRARAVEDQRAGTGNNAVELDRSVDVRAVGRGIQNPEIFAGENQLF